MVKNVGIISAVVLRLSFGCDQGDLVGGHHGHSTAVRGLEAEHDGWFHGGGGGVLGAEEGGAGHGAGEGGGCGCHGGGGWRGMRKERC
ncbi:hypothetical protein HanIR_Chr10g0476741 [Helianthus annuus]|nr:hypothetical protein HanIR_Chr10g0476741 [Helianthus annuus]